MVVILVLLESIFMRFMIAQMVKNGSGDKGSMAVEGSGTFEGTVILPPPPKRMRLVSFGMN